MSAAAPVKVAIVLALTVSVEAASRELRLDAVCDVSLTVSVTAPVVRAFIAVRSVEDPPDTVMASFPKPVIVPAVLAA